jgi:iron complex transport system substrate-binding protein
VRDLLRALLGLAAAIAISAPAQAQAAPKRIVSMNLCTDQLALMIADPGAILSLSNLSHDKRSVTPQLADAANRYPINHGLAEEILALKPDIVLAGSFSSRASVQLLKKLGVNVVEFAPASSIADIRRDVEAMGKAVGQTGRAHALMTEMDRRLEVLAADRPAPHAQPVFAEIDVNYWIAGDGTLSADLANAAGVRLLGQKLGYRGIQKLPLELLLTQKPDLYSHATRFADPPSLSTNGLDHPALRRLEKTSHPVQIPESLTLCGTPHSLDAAEILAKARRTLGTRG